VRAGLYARTTVVNNRAKGRLDKWTDISG